MKEIKRVCVVGAGAIGSLFAGHLGSLVEACVLTRRQNHCDQLNAEGLRVSGKSERQTKINASTDPGDLGDVDLVIIAAKANDVEACAKRLEGHFLHAMVMTVQNGLGCEELVARYGDWPIISAVTFMSGTRHSDVHVEYELDTATWLGPWAQGSATYDRAKQVAALIVKSGLKAEAFPDLLPAQWSKLVFNSVVNSVSAVTDLPHVKAFAERDALSDLGHLVFAMIEEGKRVAEALGVTMDEDPWEMNCRAVGRGQTGGEEYAHVTSMQADVRARRHTEIDWITGAIVREANKVGVPVPIHETLYRLVKGLESGWESKWSSH
jgi:2-dehydropantoate 2-reductase